MCFFGFHILLLWKLAVNMTPHIYMRILALCFKVTILHILSLERQLQNLYITINSITIPILQMKKEKKKQKTLRFNEDNYYTLIFKTKWQNQTLIIGLLSSIFTGQQPHPSSFILLTNVYFHTVNITMFLHFFLPTQSPHVSFLMNVFRFQIKINS